MLECRLLTEEMLICELDTGGEAKTQSKTVTPTAEPQTVLPDAGWLLSSVQLTAPLSQEKTVTPSDEAQEVIPDEDYLLSKVTVEAIPSEYHNTSDADAVSNDIAPGKIAYSSSGKIIGTSPAIIPSGIINLSENGNGYDVSQYATANVNTDPAKGIVFYNFNEEGLPTAVRTVNYTQLPNSFFTNYGYDSTDVNTTLRSLVKRINTIVLNEGITTIGYTVFQSCKLLTEMVIPSTVTNMMGGFRYCSNLRRVEFLGYSSFSDYYNFVDCTSMETVIFRRGVPVLNSPRFGKNMKLYDFSGATAITTLNSNSPDGVNGDIGTDHNGCIIKVPQALLADWQNAPNWRDVTGLTWEGV